VLLTMASTLSAAASREKLTANMARYGTAFIPLAFASHASLMLKGLLSTDFPTMWAWVKSLVATPAAAATASAAAAAIAPPGDLFDPAVVAFVQGLTLIGGVVATLIAVVFVARRVEKTAVMARALPHLLVAVVVGAGLMYCLMGRAVKAPAPAAPEAVTQPAAPAAVK